MKKSNILESAVNRRESTLFDSIASTVIPVAIAALVIAAVVISLVGCTPIY